MTSASNRLPELQSQIREAHDAVQRHVLAAADKALIAGEMLIEAKSLCRHGEWADWLKTAGIPQRSAQRYMLLRRAGFESATVAYLGFATAERYAADGFKILPPTGRAIFGYGGRDREAEAMWYFWKHTDNLVGFWFVDLFDDRFYTRSRPMRVWYLAPFIAELTKPFAFISHRDTPIDEAVDFRKEFESLDVLPDSLVS